MRSADCRTRRRLTESRAIGRSKDGASRPSRAWPRTSVGRSRSCTGAAGRAALDGRRLLRVAARCRQAADRPAPARRGARDRHAARVGRRRPIPEARTPHRRRYRSGSDGARPYTLIKPRRLLNRHRSSGSLGGHPAASGVPLHATSRAACPTAFPRPGRRPPGSPERARGCRPLGPARALLPRAPRPPRAGPGRGAPWPGPGAA